MILKDGTKHACRSCITGHRSSKCVHHDRELFPIAKKGRPSTQCKACKQRGSTPAGRCECQSKRKTKSQVMSAPGESISKPSHTPNHEGSTSQREGVDSSTSQFSSLPPSESGSYSHMLPYPAGTVDGTSSHATNSSASSPSYSQQSFALHNPLDHHLLPGGLPFPQPDPHFAYSIAHQPVHPEHHLELPLPRNLPAGVVRSRPGLAGEEEVPWWLYRGGYSPDLGQPYEPPLPVTASTGNILQASGTSSLYSDYAQFMPQPSPFALGTPGGTLPHPPAFVWHNNATSYRDYMATHHNNNPGTQSTSLGASQSPRVQENHYAPAPPSAVYHHHNAPYGQVTTLHQNQADRQNDHERSWGSSAIDRSPYHPDTDSNGRRASAPTSRHFHTLQSDGPEHLPALNYDSGSSRITSAGSITSSGYLPAPVSSGTIIGKERFGSRDHSQSVLSSYDAAIHGRRSTSFDQVMSRASPINLTMPEDRKKRKFDSEN